METIEQERNVMSEMIIYENNSGDIKVDVTFEDENLWLSQAQLCEVFGKKKLR